uniref:Peptidase A1 domain-containing protein n=1 Tax=Setaria viridis TaxID=4556 RepID=A0A4U6UYV4_SETVI|nr:hypothetical protein SEVIR_4G184100v2 [Setaria viridis]
MASAMPLALLLLCLLILHRDGLRMRYLNEVQAAAAADTAPAPSATPASGLSVPATQNVISGLPGVFSYTVLAGYGTPAQQLPLYFDVTGMSNLRCKPCFSGVEPCDQAFDPSRSSSFRTVPCGSPDCTQASCSSGSSCTFTFYNSTFVFGNGTVVTDTLTLSPSATFEDFTVGCMQLDNLFSDGAAAGNIDLSRSRHSLATRVLLSSPPGSAAFSYCLPASKDTQGFLNIAPALSDYSGHGGVKHVPLVTNPRGPNFYFIDLVAIAINGKDLPFPPATFRGNGTMIDTQAEFTYLNPLIYTALRDEFRTAMTKYQPAPAFSDLDTCYNFTGINYIELPDITFRFGNGETMELDDRQFMYFFREHLDDAFPFGCMAFAASPDPNFAWNLLGSQVQRTKEIVYDVRGGKVAFVPSRCGLR